jgi:hypothetical protein
MSTYAGIKSQRTEYHEGIDSTLGMGKTTLVPKRSELLSSATGRTSHRVCPSSCPLDGFGTNQIPKEKPMFRTFSMMTLFGLATICTAYAQSEQPIQSKIPFDFTAHTTTLLKGTYRLTYNKTAHTLYMRGLDQNSRAAFVFAQPAIAFGSSNAAPKLVFECYEKTCYLARVWQGSVGGDRGLELLQPKHRRRLAFETRVVSITIPAK